jgi:IS1 transposase
MSQGYPTVWRVCASRNAYRCYEIQTPWPFMDEFWSFVVAKRRQRWTWYGYDRHMLQKSLNNGYF